MHNEVLAIDGKRAAVTEWEYTSDDKGETLTVTLKDPSRKQKVRPDSTASFSLSDGVNMRMKLVRQAKFVGNWKGNTAVFFKPIPTSCPIESKST